MPRQSGEGAPGLMGSVPRPSGQEQMEQAIRAELWEVLDSSDLESITSKEVGRVPGTRAGAGSWLWGPPAGPQSGPLLGASHFSFPAV